jgi:hypothetical protein
MSHIKDLDFLWTGKLEKHLPGEHDQETHGNRDVPPDPPKELKYMTSAEVYTWLDGWFNEEMAKLREQSGPTGNDQGWEELYDIKRQYQDKYTEARKEHLATPVEGVPAKPTSKYREEIRAWATAEEKRYGGVISSPDGVVILSSPYRATDQTDAMAQFMEKRSSRASMVRALSSQTSWNMGGGWAEWAAAAKICGREAPPQPESYYGKPEPDLSDDDLKAYKARMEFIQAHIRHQYGDEITVFRGLKGAFARKVKEAAVQVAREVGNHFEAELPVRELSSWTPSQSTAEDFAYGYTRSGRNKHGKGIVVSMTMKTDDVFNSNEVGAKNVIRFTDDHDELVMLGREPTVKVRIVQWEN